MAEEIINKLEKAVQVILAPPNLFTVEQRQSAVEVFLNFRKTKSPYQLCRQILETNTYDYILFEAAGLLKIALVEERVNLPKEEIYALRQYLLHYVISKPQLDTYIKGKILQVIVIIIKKNRNSDSEQEQQQFLDEVESLIMTGDLTKKILGCNLISAILQEYRFDAKTSNIGYSMGIHYAEKVAFERGNLKRIFKFCFGILDELIISFNNYKVKDVQDDTLALLKHLLPILETIFTWPMSSNMPLLYYKHDNTSDDEPEALILDESWQDVILLPRVQDLFFTLYWKIRDNPQLAYLARICLVQLGTLGGSIFSSKEMKVEYFSNYTRKFLEFIINIEIIDQEAPEIARIVKQLSIFVNTNFTILPEHMVKEFMEQLCRLTYLYVENSAQEEFSYASECLFSEGLDILFRIWINISLGDMKFLLNKKGVVNEFCKQSFTRIFTTYVQCHLCPPEGVRNLDEKDLNKTKDENEDDKDRFKEKLQAIGCFGRIILNHSLPLLSHLIKDRTMKLCEILNKVVEQADSLSTLNKTYTCKLYEDIHWLLLISGHVLCMESVGEEAVMPSEINDYSKEQANQGKVDINLTSQLLQASDDVSLVLNVAIESVDHVIYFVTNIFRLCTIEKKARSVHLGSIFSPALSCTIIWFLNRWAGSYLLPEESLEVPSIVFLEVFGDSSSGATWAILFLLDKIECDIIAFKNEPKIMHEIIILLKSLVVSRKKAREILKYDRFKPIWDMAVKGIFDFPSKVKISLIEVVTICIFANQDSKTDDYWSQALFQPFVDKYIQITSFEKFLKNHIISCQQEEIKVQIIDIFERFIGIAQGFQHLFSSSKIFIEYMFPVLEELPNLLSLYHNYQQIVQLILKLLSEYSQVMVHVNLSRNEKLWIREIFMNIMKHYARYSNNRFPINLDEEDNYQDLQFIMEMLYNMLLKETFLIDVFLCGLNIVMPLVTINLLQFPILCSLYYKIISHFCTNFFDKTCNLPPELMQSMLESLERGLFSTINGVSWMCFDTISYLAEHIHLHTLNGHPQNQILAPFLKLLMTALFTQEIDESFLSAACLPFYHLITCYQEEYKQLVQNILVTQSDQQIVRRLADAFTKLTKKPGSANVNYKKTIISVRLILIAK